MDYPRNVYIVPGELRLAGGGTYGLESVKTKEAHEAALKKGYFDTIPEAVDAFEAVEVTLEDNKPRRGRPPKVD